MHRYITFLVEVFKKFIDNYIIVNQTTTNKNMIYENRDLNTTTVTEDNVKVDVNVWDLMTNLLENQTEDTYYVDKLEQLKSELELHVEENE